MPEWLATFNQHNELKKDCCIHWKHAFPPAHAAYKFNNWVHRSLTNATNYYATDTDSVGVGWSTNVDDPFQNAYPPYTTDDSTNNFYPFASSDATAETVLNKVARITSDLLAISVPATFLAPSSEAPSIADCT